MEAASEGAICVAPDSTGDHVLEQGCGHAAAHFYSSSPGDVRVLEVQLNGSKVSAGQVARMTAGAMAALGCTVLVQGPAHAPATVQGLNNSVALLAEQIVEASAVANKAHATACEANAFRQ